MGSGVSHGGDGAGPQQGAVGDGQAEGVAHNAAKAKATVAEQRKGGQVCMKKAGTALIKEPEKLFKEYAPAA